MGIKHFLKGIFFFSVFIFWFCDAPRNNPFDPENSDYQSALDLTGRVYTYRVPHIAVSNAKVTWDSRRIDYTRSDGSFRFIEVVKEPGWLYFEDKTYLFDSMYVDWESTGPDILKYLNTKPVLDSIQFFSSIVNKNDDRQLISVEANLHVSDPDNDIDSVLITSPTLNFNSFLNYNISDKSFEGSFDKIGEPDAVIGHDFDIYIIDTQKNRIYLSTEFIKRIIKDEVVELIEPINSDTASTTPTLEWKRTFDPGFPFKYMVEIYLDENFPTLVWRKENIIPNQTVINSITVDVPLAEDRYYFWNVWVVDEFQNRSGSKTKTFYAKSL